MQLLFDENLSERLAARLMDVYPGSVHVSAIGLAGSPDLSIWRAAIDGQFILVTKDADFQRLSILRGCPPKVVWIRLGNCSMLAVEHLLRTRIDHLQDFVANPVAAFLSLG